MTWEQQSSNRRDKTTGIMVIPLSYIAFQLSIKNKADRPQMKYTGETVYVKTVYV